MSERRAGYRELFRTHIPEIELNAMREATNKAWVLGNDRFKEKVQRADRVCLSCDGDLDTFGPYLSVELNLAGKAALRCLGEQVRTQR